jgi:hypothetical protein
MRVFDPPSVIEFTWGPDLLRIELQADGEGTLLTLTDTFDELGKAARDAAGWHECLNRLVGDLDGESLSGWGTNWHQLNKIYQERFGPEASVLGPPAGYDEQLSGHA